MTRIDKSLSTKITQSYAKYQAYATAVSDDRKPMITFLLMDLKLRQRIAHSLCSPVLGRLNPWRFIKDKTADLIYFALRPLNPEWD